jgi:hypothetical protein
LSDYLLLAVCLKIANVTQFFGYVLMRSNVSLNFDEKKDLLTFWAIFSQTNLVTLETGENWTRQTVIREVRQIRKYNSQVIFRIFLLSEF